MKDTFKIIQDGYKTKIFIGEKQIPYVRSYSLSQYPGETPILTLEIMPDIKQIELDGKIVYRYYDVNGNELVPKE
jgi:Na+-transporting NADH:ubiquinone oxidoreductase subunit NqrF